MFILTMQETIFKKLFQYSSYDEGRLKEDPKANQVMRQICNKISEIPKEEFIAWLIAENNKLCCYKISPDALKLIHSIFAKQLWEYHKQCHPGVDFPDSQYVRDAILNRTYGFFSAIILEKHVNSSSNIMSLKYMTHKHDPVYSSLQDTFSSKAGDGLAPLGKSTNYTHDQNFKKIVQFQNESTSPVFFTGISDAKSGLMTLLEIMIDNLALIRFCGSLGLEVNRREDVAYAHGPFFMRFSEFTASEIPDQKLLRVSTSDIIFILPTESARSELLNLLKIAVELGLLDQNLSEKLAKNIMTYETYVSKYCIEDTADFSANSSKTANSSSFFSDSLKSADSISRAESMDISGPNSFIKKPGSG